MLTIDSTRVGIKRNTRRKLRRDGADKLDTVDNGLVAELLALLDADVITAVIDVVDGHRETKLLDIGELTASTQGLDSTLVELGAVLVGIASLNSTSKAVLRRLAGGLESLGVQAQLSELEAVARTKGAGGLQGRSDTVISASSDRHSVLVVDLAVVEVVGSLEAVTREDLASSLVEDGPVDTVVGTLDSPGTRGSDVAGRTRDEGVGGDELSSVVVVGPGRSGTDAARTSSVDAALDVIEQLAKAFIIGNIAGGNTI